VDSGPTHEEPSDTWWSVHAEAVGDEAYDEDRLEDLLDNLSEHDGVVTGTPVEPRDGMARYGAGFSVQAADVVEAVARAREVFEGAAAASGLPRWPLARVEARTERELELELARPSFPELLGVAELAERLAVSRQRAWTITGRPDFPDPVARLKATPVWTADSVRRFLASWPRKAGRPLATARPEAG
jgi:hypothetical protein